MQHHYKSTGEIQHCNGKVFRPVVRELCNLKKVGGCPRHDFACPVRVVIAERQLLKMVKDIAPHILLNAVSKNVTPVSHKKVAALVKAEACKQHCNQNQKSAHLVVGNKRAQRIAREHWKRNVDCRHKNCTCHISSKQFPVRLIISKKNLERML